MKRWMTMIAVAVLLAVPTLAFAGGSGSYLWTVSSSNSDPNVNTGPDTIGINTLFLWFVESCNPGTEFGMSAAEMGFKTLGDWQILGFNVQNGFLNAGNQNNLLLAVGGCPDGPVVAGSILANSTGGVGGVNLGVNSEQSGTASTVNCEPLPDQFEWPTAVRFVGFQTAGHVGTPQNHGSSCGGIVSVEPSSWGTVKALYR